MDHAQFPRLSSATSLDVEKTLVQNPKIHKLFQACDTSGRGSIGPQEFSELCQTFGIGHTEAQVIFVDLDHDGDGRIDFDDFKHGFSDYLTPGSRRGSLQVNLSDGGNAMQQLLEMEKKHATAKEAWKHFVTSVESNSDLPLNGKSGRRISKDFQNNPRIDEDVSLKLEQTLSSLITDVQNLHEEYKTLESSFKKEREAHAVQLAALGEELDHQLAKAEAKAKDEARQEAQRQMDSERKKITVEMESKLNELTAQIKTFEKVEEWLSEEARGKSRNVEESSKRIETESENRKLRSALVEAQMKATLLQSQLTQKRNEYLDLYQEFHSEKVAAKEYRNQCDLMQNHLSILSQANRVLSDANDCFSNSGYTVHPGQSLDDETHETLNHNGPTSVTYEGSNNSRSKLRELKYNSLPPSCSAPRSLSSAFSLVDLDRDSGTETLLDELRAESESSPLPSGRWSELSSTTPEGSPMLTARSSLNLTQAPDFVASIIPPPPTFQSQTIPTGPPNHNQLPRRTFKVILAGDAAVGKTSFIERACHGHFAAHLSSTIGVDFRVKMIEIDGNSVALQLWDTAGQERFRSLTKSYFRRADGVILVYDVSSEQTFLSIRHWVQNVEEGAGRKLPIVICGNKVDLRADWYKGGACISHEEGVKLSREYQTLFIEVSPKTGFNVMEALLLLTTEMSQVEDAELRSSVNLAAFSNPDKKKKSCCDTNS